MPPLSRSTSLPLHTMQSQSSTATPQSSKWGPYSNAKDFNINMASILIILVCTTALGFSFHALLRFILRRFSGDNTTATTENSEDKDKARDTATLQLASDSIVFEAGTTAVVGELECAICLAELVDGERVRVLQACGHGFHAECVEGWLVGKSSCPTCRAECRAEEVEVVVV